MDSRRWGPGGVRRDDQFTQAPDFYDEHDSDHLPMAGRIAATWHGWAPSRRVVVAASLLAIAGSFAFLAIALAPPADGPSPSGGGPVGASDGGPSVPSPLPSVTVPDRPLGNATASPTASPGPPVLPMPTFPS